MSFSIATIALLIGAMLCLRLNVFTLCAAIVAVTVGLWVSDLARRTSFGETMLINLLLVFALEFGYLFGIVLKAVTTAFYERRTKKSLHNHGAEIPRI
jgi:hypothetical protein